MSTRPSGFCARTWSTTGICVAGGGVTAGIDFALTVAAEAFDPDLARSIQLGIEYDPHPPFDCGSPERAGPELVAKVRQNAAKVHAERQAAVEQAEAVVKSDQAQIDSANLNLTFTRITAPFAGTITLASTRIKASLSYSFRPGSAVLGCDVPIPS